MSLPYLYANQNRHAPLRSNGRRFWGYPSRTAAVRVIVIHTAENTPDYLPPDGGAEAVARYQATGVTAANASSYHEIVDSDSHVVCLPPEAVAFGARGANADGWHLSFATKAALWSSKPVAWRNAAIERGANRARIAADRFGIPVRRLTRAQFLAGESGFVAHGDVDPGRRTDPGPAFPWADFLDLVKRQQTTPPPSTPRPPVTDDWDHLMTTLNDKEKKALKDFAAYLAGPDGTRGDSFARQLLQFHRVDRPRLTKLADDIERLTNAGKTSLQGVIIGSANMIDAVRHLGYEIGTTSRTGVKRR